MHRRLCDSASDEYIFEHNGYARPRSAGALPDAARAAWSALAEEEERDLPPAKELAATFDCDNAMRAVFEKYRRGVRGWRRETDGGAVIEGFGAAAATMISDTLAAFDHDARPYRGSKAFRRKKDELQALLDADLYVLFVAQIAKLRETTYRAFKEALEALADADEALEKKVNTALKDCQRGFRTGAEALRPKNSAWRFDNEVKELAAQMREDATERLQIARLADYQENGGRRRRRRAPRRSMGGKPSNRSVSVSITLTPRRLASRTRDTKSLAWMTRSRITHHPGILSAVVGQPANGGGIGEEGITIPLLPERGKPWNRFG